MNKYRGEIMDCGETVVTCVGIIALFTYLIYIVYKE